MYSRESQWGSEAFAPSEEDNDETDDSDHYQWWFEEGNRRKDTVESSLERIRSFEHLTSIFTGVWDDLESIDADASLEQVNAALDASWKRAFSRFSEKERLSFAEYFELVVRQEEVERKIRAEIDKDSGPVEALARESEDLAYQIMDVQAESGIGKSHPILRLKAFLESKKRQFETTRKLREGSQEQLIIFINQTSVLDRSITGQDISDTRWYPLAIVVMVKDPTLVQTTSGEQTGDRNWGLHLSGTPVNLILDTPSSEETVQHELVHTIVDSIGLDVHGPLDAVWENGLDMEWMMQYSADDFLDLSHEEFLAEMSVAEKVHFGLDLVPESDRQLFEHVTAYLATAGKHANQFIEWLEHGHQTGTLIDESGEEFALNEEQIAWCHQIATEYQVAFLKAVRSLDQALRRASEAGEDAHKKVHMMTLMLLPSQYRALPALLKRSGKIGVRS